MDINKHGFGKQISVSSGRHGCMY